MWEVTFVDGKLDWRLQAHLQVDCFVLQIETTHPGSLQNISMQICNVTGQDACVLVADLLRCCILVVEPNIPLKPMQVGKSLPVSPL